MKHILLKSTASTNRYAREHIDDFEGMTMVRAEEQTAGRGQRGNSWEAAPGDNLTVTVAHRPEGVAPLEQFALSEAVALGVCDFLAGLGVATKVKWPNDIYAGDRKICGILLEHSLSGQTIQYTLSGVGININQTRFVSDAPNPVSVSQLTGLRYDLGELTEQLGDCLELRLLRAGSAAGRVAQHREMLGRLWRGDGELHRFLDSLKGEEMLARIEDVEAGGRLWLQLASGERRGYYFKEVAFLPEQ